MRELKVAKYQIRGTLGPVIVFYAIFISMIALLFGVSFTIGEDTSSSGHESASILFLFIAGLNSFKGNFKLFQANNVSRKTFVRGLIIGVFPIAFGMSLIDLAINRIYNIFEKCPTIFDMMYGSFRQSRANWIQANDIQTLFGTTFWNFALYSIVFILGILISLCYYRSNKTLKVIISVVPAILLGFVINASQIPVGSTNISIGKFLASAFGWQSQNPYIAVLSFAVLGTLFSIAIYLLTRKAVLKD
jgi:hypothetical protein